MTHFDEIYEAAADNYGIITASEAASLGIAKSELSRWVSAGKLVKRGRGVFRLARHTPTPYDRFAEAVALAGKDSFLIGESVLAMHDLALVNPKRLTVGTPRRVRRALPPWIEVVTTAGKSVVTYEGIPSQSVAEALLDCKGRIMNARLKEAAESARREGLLTSTEYEELKGAFE